MTDLSADELIREADQEEVETAGKRMARLARDLDLKALDDELEDDEDYRRPRATRDMKTRKPEKKITWRPANHLPDPPQTPGWRHRWVRVSLSAGVDDSTNMSKAMREGWRPCVASEYPDVTQTLFGRGANLDIIEFGGLVLCRIPEELARERDAYFSGLAKRQLKSIKQRIRENAGNDDRLEFHAQSRTEVKSTYD